MQYTTLENEEIKKHMFISIHIKKDVNTIQQQFMLEEPPTSYESGNQMRSSFKVIFLSKNL